jgi:hypothetical protein
MRSHLLSLTLPLATKSPPEGMEEGLFIHGYMLLHAHVHPGADCQ